MRANLAYVTGFGKQELMKDKYINCFLIDIPSYWLPGDLFMSS